VYREKRSGREGVKRLELEKAIGALGPGDVLVFAEWDRATRSMLDGIRIIERVAARGATFKALDRQWLDLTAPLGEGILAFLSVLAEDERSRILARANGGRAAGQEERRQIRTQAEARSASATGGGADGALGSELACGRPSASRHA
jgi:DNA invertase Pin-like site-specific DNA recombinase